MSSATETKQWRGSLEDLQIRNQNTAQAQDCKRRGKDPRSKAKKVDIRLCELLIDIIEKCVWSELYFPLEDQVPALIATFNKRGF